MVNRFKVSHQISKKSSPMKGGGVLFYDFDLSDGERIGDMPPVNFNNMTLNNNKIMSNIFWYN